MIAPITRRDVIAYQSVVPWPSQIQVEQDLLLCRAMAALFDDAFLQSQIAMRGGTLLHKVLPYAPKGHLVVITPHILALSFFGAVIMGFIAGIYPAFRASSMKPIEAIRKGE